MGRALRRLTEEGACALVPRAASEPAAVIRRSVKPSPAMRAVSCCCASASPIWAKRRRMLQAILSGRLGFFSAMRSGSALGIANFRSSSMAVMRIESEDLAAAHAGPACRAGGPGEQRAGHCDAYRGRRAAFEQRQQIAVRIRRAELSQGLSSLRLHHGIGVFEQRCDAAALRDIAA